MFAEYSSICYFTCFQVELRTKMVEAKYHEDKLKLQQQHDVAVQKVFGDYFQYSSLLKSKSLSSFKVT